MDSSRGKTVYRRSNAAMHKWLQARCPASTGPYPNITGMREKYWGRGANIVKCGQFIYLLPRDTAPEAVPQL